MTIKAVLYVMSPMSAVAQLTALRSAHPAETVEATVVVHWPFADAELTGELAEAVGAMLSDAKDVGRLVAAPQSVVDEALSAATPEARCAAFAEWLGENGFDEIYYPHDVAGYVYQLLAGANPTARKITTGDNIGHVFEREVYFSHLPGAGKSAKPKLMKRVKATIRRAMGKREKAVARPATPPVADHLPDEAALLLPVDQSGNFLKQTTLRIPPKAMAQQVLAECAAAASELDGYCRSLVDAIGDRRAFVLCTQNYAEAGTISFEREIEMWAGFIRAICPEGAVVFLKTHPGETLERGEALNAALAGRNELRTLDKRFRRFPIELWRTLLSHVDVISGSMPSLSLKYLYDKDCIQPFSAAVIEQYFSPEYWGYYKNGLDLYVKPLEALPDWDGKSVLYSGS